VPANIFVWSGGALADERGTGKSHHARQGKDGRRHPGEREAFYMR
jgi:hypothetical protein